MRSRIIWALSAALTLTLSLGVALPAWAADADNEKTEYNIFAGDIGNVLWTLITFGLAIFVLGKFAWGPFLGMLQTREDFIRDSLAQAKADREAAEARLQEYEQRLTEARAEATEIVEEGRRDAEVVARKVQADAQEEAEKMLERAKREIRIARETAVKELYEQTGVMATHIASKIVERELQPQDHQRLINQALDELDSRAERPS
ncbi:MAG: F0F1 ATP synthase subunit B [Acidobacteriota bacterium]